MKKLILAAVMTTAIAYAGDAQVELEHAIKSPSGVESVAEDMSAMKAAGRCGAAQSTTKRKTVKYTQSRADVELEHAIKSPSGVDGVAEDMSAMKAAGKCSADQSGKIKTKTKVKPHKPSKAELELEHANRLPTGDDGYTKGMGNMKAQGKCGSN